jgi:hypothetical protein
VKHSVLPVDDQIQHEHGQCEFQPQRPVHPVEQPPTALRDPDREGHFTQGQDQAHCQRADGADTQVVEPTARPGNVGFSARAQALGQRHQCEHGQKKTEADGAFLVQDEGVVHGITVH